MVLILPILERRLSQTITLKSFHFSDLGCNLEATLVVTTFPVLVCGDRFETTVQWNILWRWLNENVVKGENKSSPNNTNERLNSP
jgi:hypothetical protein